MLSDKRLIRPDDPVIVYSSSNNMDVVYITPDKMYDSKYGHYYHNNLVGLEFGTKVYDNTGKRYIYVIKPTPELWTLSLHHRTEILYSADISLIVYYLELKPGSIVLETGTGSGSLSTAIARSISPTGHLYTYEFHKGRAEAAIADFQKNKIDHLITVSCCDACTEGFNIEDETADAVFLDLPSPWLAIPHALKKLKPNSRLCSFSPCIEQVQKMCGILAETGFTEITTLECLVRPYDVLDLSNDLPEDEPEQNQKKKKNNGKRKVQDSKMMTTNDNSLLVTRPVQLIRGHTGYLTFATKILSGISK